MLLLRALLLTAISVLLATSAEGRKGFGPGEQEYGYVDVRPGAHMFYWLYYTSATPTYTKKPLVMWLHGGPGQSSSSLGNFEEIGPLTADLKLRNSTWVQHVNVLFVDNPVGTGFSYVEKLEAFTTNNTQIARDLVEFMRSFLKQYPSFEMVPFFIFGQDYGGKMAAEFALELDKERKSGKIKVNLQGIAMGDPWISPIDSVLNWAPYLFQTGLVDQAGYYKVDGRAKSIQRSIWAGKWGDAFYGWMEAKKMISSVSGNVNFDNILTPIKQNPNPSNSILSERPYQSDGRATDQELQDLMNGKVRFALGNTIPASVKHSFQRESVFTHLIDDFMRNATDLVEGLLNSTKLHVMVYTGQLNLVAPTAGTETWVNGLKWPMGKFWNKEAKRQELIINGTLEGFLKEAKFFSMYWINRSGHIVPVDNVNATYQILRTLTKFDKT